MLANSLRGELGTFTGPVSTSGSHEPAKCPEPMPASTSTSPCSLLSPSAVEVLEAAPAAGSLVWSQGYPRFTPSTHVLGTGWVCRRDRPASAALAQPRNGVRAESKVLAWCLHKFCFKGLQFFTLQSSQAGGNAKRWLCKLLLPAVWRNWD